MQVKQQDMLSLPFTLISKENENILIFSAEQIKSLNSSEIWNPPSKMRLNQQIVFGFKNKNNIFNTYTAHQNKYKIKKYFQL